MIFNKGRAAGRSSRKTEIFAMQSIPQSNLAQRTVGDLVAEDYRLGSVFKRFGIDFCCGGGRTVADACVKHGVTLDQLDAALAEVRTSSESRGDGDARHWPLDFLVDYITNVHHRFVRDRLPVLNQFASKVARVHGNANPELVELGGLVGDLTTELLDHLAGEEETLFPYVKDLVVAKAQDVRPSRPDFGTAKHPITSMEHEHDGAGDLMKRMRTITDGFTPPSHACNTYRALFATLEEFEEDLHRHVHLENNILFPRALALEEELFAD